MRRKKLELTDSKKSIQASVHEGETSTDSRGKEKTSIDRGNQTILPPAKLSLTDAPTRQSVGPQRGRASYSLVAPLETLLRQLLGGARAEPW